VAWEATKPGTIKAQAEGTDSDPGLRRGADDGVSGCRNRTRTYQLGNPTDPGP
jgi:hypothetical protein